MSTDVNPGEPDEKGRKGIGESVDSLPVSLIRCKRDFWLSLRAMPWLRFMPSLTS